MGAPWLKYSGGDKSDAGPAPSQGSNDSATPPAVQEQQGPWSRFKEVPKPAVIAVPPPKTDDKPAGEKPDRLNQNALEAGREASKNVVPSAVEAIKGLVHSLQKPWETIGTLGSVAAAPLTVPIYGGLSALEDWGEYTGSNPMKGNAAAFRDAVIQPGLDLGSKLQDRYGGLFGGKGEWGFTPGAWINNMLNTIITDPVGVVTDVAGGKPRANVGVATGVSHLPVVTAERAAELASRGMKAGIDYTIQAHEGIGPGAVRDVAQAARDSIPGVRQAIMRGVDNQDILRQAHGAVDDLVTRRGVEYNRNMAVFQGADSPVDFSRVDRAISGADDILEYRGRSGVAQPFDMRTDQQIAARDRINREIEAYRALDPREFHTAYGFDKLKQKIQGIIDAVPLDDQMAKPLHAYGNRVTAALRDTIRDVAPPEYVTAMEEYGRRTDQLRDLKKEFKLGDKNTDIQAVKALQKVYRRSADVAHGEKENLLREALRELGNDTLMAHLAAGQFHPPMPQGLRGLAPGALVGGVLAGAINPWTAALGALAISPRVTGLGAYGAGRAAHMVDRASAAFANRTGITPGQIAREGSEAALVPVGALSTPASIVAGRENKKDEELEKPPGLAPRVVFARGGALRTRSR